MKGRWEILQILKYPFAPSVYRNLSYSYAFERRPASKSSIARIFIFEDRVDEDFPELQSLLLLVHR